MAETFNNSQALFLLWRDGAFTISSSLPVQCAFDISCTRLPLIEETNRVKETLKEYDEIIKTKEETCKEQSKQIEQGNLLSRQQRKSRPRPGKLIDTKITKNFFRQQDNNAIKT